MEPVSPAAESIWFNPLLDRSTHDLSTLISLKFIETLIFILKTTAAVVWKRAIASYSPLKSLKGSAQSSFININ